MPDRADEPVVRPEFGVPGVITELAQHGLTSVGESLRGHGRTLGIERRDFASGQRQQLSETLRGPVETLEQRGLLRGARSRAALNRCRVWPGNILRIGQDARSAQALDERRTRARPAVVIGQLPAQRHIRARCQKLREQVVLLLEDATLERNLRQQRLERAAHTVRQQRVLEQRPREGVAIHAEQEEVFEGM
jgi:hypothetical protein